MEESIVCIPVWSETVKLNIPINELLELTTINKSFRTYFENNEKRIYLDRVYSMTKADLTICTLDELRLLVIRLNCYYTCLFTVNNPNSFRFYLIRGLLFLQGK
jgi:hypothetical protein